MAWDTLQTHTLSIFTELQENATHSALNLVAKMSLLAMNTRQRRSPIFSLQTAPKFILTPESRREFHKLSVDIKNV